MGTHGSRDRVIALCRQHVLDSKITKGARQLEGKTQLRRRTRLATATYFGIVWMRKQAGSGRGPRPFDVCHNTFKGNCQERCCWSSSETAFPFLWMAARTCGEVVGEDTVRRGSHSLVVFTFFKGKNLSKNQQASQNNKNNHKHHRLPLSQKPTPKNRKTET